MKPCELEEEKEYKKRQDDDDKSRQIIYLFCCKGSFWPGFTTKICQALARGLQGGTIFLKRAAALGQKWISWPQAFGLQLYSR